MQVSPGENNAGQIDPNSPTVQNLVNSIFYVFNNPSRGLNSTSLLHHWVRQFCRLFGEEKKAQDLFDIWDGKAEKVGTAMLEIKVLQKVFNPGKDNILRVAKVRCSVGALNRLLEVRRMKMLDIFTDICVKHAVEVPVQWDAFNPTSEKGGLPTLGADALEN